MKAQEGTHRRAPVVKPGALLARRYRVERVLGRGGMGLVLVARDLELDRKVAVKLVIPELVHDTSLVARLKREARAAVRLTNEHSVRVHDVREDDSGVPFIVMEYLVGHDIAALLSARGALPIEEAVDWVLQAAEGVAEAHAHGIVHRDLKPGTLFLARQPGGTSVVKVLDFGLAKPAPGADATLTRSTAVMGSPNYMSPEQMRGLADVDARADVWALGACLYEMLVGKPPFDAPSVPDVIANVMHVEPTRADALRPDVPHALAVVVARCLAKKRSERFPNVADLARALAPFTVDGQSAAERVERVLTTAARVPSERPPPFEIGDTGLSRGPAGSPVPADTRTEATFDSEGDRAGVVGVRRYVWPVLGGAVVGAIALAAVAVVPRAMSSGASSPATTTAITTATATPTATATATTTTTTTTSPTATAPVERDAGATRRPTRALPRVIKADPGSHM